MAKPRPTRYDPSGQFLTSYTDIYGTTNYTYVTGQSAPETTHSQRSPMQTTPTSTSATTPQGRLIDQHRDGGQEDETGTYLNPGAM